MPRALDFDRSRWCVETMGLGGRGFDRTRGGRSYNGGGWGELPGDGRHSSWCGDAGIGDLPSDAAGQTIEG